MGERHLAAPSKTGVVGAAPLSILHTPVPSKLGYFGHNQFLGLANIHRGIDLVVRVHRTIKRPYIDVFIMKAPLKIFQAGEIITARLFIN